MLSLFIPESKHIRYPGYLRYVSEKSEELKSKELSAVSGSKRIVGQVLSSTNHPESQKYMR